MSPVFTPRAPSQVRDSYSISVTRTTRSWVTTLRRNVLEGAFRDPHSGT